MRTRSIAGVTVAGLLLAACGTDRPTPTDATAPLTSVTSLTASCRAVLVTGGLTRSDRTFPAATLTYDRCLDESGVGSNPGLELWPDASSDTAGTGRLQRSNDNNGQWNYQIAGAFAANGEIVAFGTRTGSHGPQGRVWRSTPGGSFLVQEAAAFFVPANEGSFCSQALTLTGRTDAVHVTYDRDLDDSGAGSNPGLVVRSGSCTGAQIWRANDNNGQWNYRIDGVFVVGGQLRIVGARNSSGRNAATWQPRVWSQPAGGSFLAQSVGL